MQTVRLMVVLALTTAVAGGAAVAASSRVTDHHVHILSPTLVAEWKSLGVPFSKPDAAYVSAAALLGGDDAPLAAAQLVPMAHLYAADWFQRRLNLSDDEVYARVRAENDWVAAEATRYPGRAVAFCSVSLRRTWAWEEVRRCRSELGSAGIKIHLAAAGTDLRDEEQLAAIERLAAWAEEGEVPLLVHFDPQQEGLERADVEHFIARVLAPHPGLRIQIAHLGGSGGYGAWTQTVFGAFTDWLAAEEKAGRPRPGVTFDLAAVILAEPSEGVPATTREELGALGRDLRRAGTGRLLFGTDYPVFPPGDSVDLWRRDEVLPKMELEQVLARRGPALAAAD